MNQKILGIFLVIFLFMQFFRLPKNEQGEATRVPFEQEVLGSAQTTTSSSLKMLLENRCYDCHSDHSRYPWYFEIAPISFWMDHHIEEGKEHLNFSRWSTYSAAQKAHKFEELIEEVEEGEMPLKSYTWIHGSLSSEEKELLLSWARKSEASYQRL